MDYQWSPEELAFQKQVREFCIANLPADWHDQNLDDEDAFEFSRECAKKLGDKGWLALAWPKEYGGMAAGHWMQAIYKYETGYQRFPGIGGIGIDIAGPTVMIYGNEEQKNEYLPSIASGQNYWCQLFTEPGAGSDLASLQTRAVEDGDDFVINGQKIFTSGGHHADFGWAGFRTDPTAPKHRGISTFIVPMHSTPGLTVRPLINMTGVHAQNEIFFDDARLGKKQMVGERNRGWYTMATTLDFERSGVARYGGSSRLLQELVNYARDTRLNGHTLGQEPGVRNKLANMAIEIEVGKYIGFRIVWMQSAKLIPNREASMSKVWGAETDQRLANTGMQIMGLYGQLRKGSKYAALAGRLERQYKATVVGTIAGGSSEVNRNIIATRGLGLPR